MKDSTNIPVTFSLSTEADKIEILALMQRIYPEYGYNEAFFNWQYKQNPSGKAKIFNIKDREKIIGIYCMIPNILYWQQRKFKLWRIQNVMVDATYRGQKLFQRLMHFSQTNPVFTSDDVFFAFPNENSYKSFQNEDFISITHPPFWIYKKGNSSNFTTKTNSLINFKQFDDIPYATTELMDSLMKTIKEGIIVKDADFLRWRYSKRPFGKYKFYGLVNNSNTLDGFAVIKYYHSNEELKLHICEMLIRNNDKDIKKIFLTEIIKLKESQNASILNMFQVVNGDEKYIEEIGFEPDFLQSRWVVFKGNENLPDDFGNPHLIDFTLGDNDIF